MQQYVRYVYPTVPWDTGIPWDVHLSLVQTHVHTAIHLALAKVPWDYGMGRT